MPKSKLVKVNVPNALLDDLNAIAHLARMPTTKLIEYVLKAEVSEAIETMPDFKSIAENDTREDQD